MKRKVGRPRLSIKDKRTVAIAAWLTPQERRDLDKVVVKLDTNVTRFLRKALDEAMSKYAPQHEEQLNT